MPLSITSPCTACLGAPAHDICFVYHRRAPRMLPSFAPLSPPAPSMPTASSPAAAPFPKGAAATAPLPKGMAPITPVVSRHGLTTHAKSGYWVPAAFQAAPYHRYQRPSTVPSQTPISGVVGGRIRCPSVELHMGSCPMSAASQHRLWEVDFQA